MLLLATWWQMKRLTNMLEAEKRAAGSGPEESLVEFEKGLWMLRFLAAVFLNFFFDAACMEIFGLGKDLLQDEPQISPL